MSSWLTDSPFDLGVAAAKAALMYGTALVGLRFGERRMIAQWRTIDFTAAVAVGAIVGRTAVAGTQTYAVGAVALISIIAVHRLASIGRFYRLFRTLVDHRIRLLVVDGRLRDRQLRRCRLTAEDLYSELRQRGHVSLTDIRYVLFEPQGGLTVVPRSAGEPAELIDDAERTL